MDFVSNQKPQIEAMLKELGISCIDELFDAIPNQLKVPAPLEDDGLSEYEGLRLMETLSNKNQYQHFDNYLGGGAYEHHIPAIVDAICSRSEFLTSYTPYQAEASQGMLQAIFEFQKSICMLTGMDVSNASLYDGASACGEALLMALRVQRNRNDILVSSTLNPTYRAVVNQYLSSHDGKVKTLPHDKDWQIDLDSLESLVDENVAAIIVQSPNFLGSMENCKEIAAKIKAKGALFILIANPLSYGIYASAGELGADIAVGDGQPFGLALEYGGPYVGYLACKKEFIRQMPGRFVGETIDGEGRRGFVLTLQAREQHIRREKATSNICTNQALAAVACLVAMMWYGKKGVPELAQANFSRASYLKSCLKKIPGCSVLNEASHFNEFVVSFGVPYKSVQSLFRKNFIEPGIHLGDFDRLLEDHFLICATETKNRQQIERYIDLATVLRRENV